MTKFCESCHTANRDRARYCRGCAGKFSGIRTAANVSADAPEGRPPPRVAKATSAARPVPIPMPAPALLPATTESDLLLAPRTIEKRQLARQMVLPRGIDVPVVLLLMVVVLSIAAFVFWYWSRTVERSLAPSGEATQIHWQQSELQAAPVAPVAPVEPTAPVAVAPIVEPQLDAESSLQEPRPETQAVAPAPAPAPAEPQIAASQEQNSQTQGASEALRAEERRPSEAEVSQAPTRQALRAPQQRAHAVPQRDSSMTKGFVAARTVTDRRHPTSDPVITDVQRSIRTELQRVDSPASAARPVVPVQIGAARTGTIPCDRYNPFGEVICASAPAAGVQASNSSDTATSGASTSQAAGKAAASKGTSASEIGRASCRERVL